MVKKVVVCNKASKELVKEYQWIKRMKEDILNLPEPVAPKDIALLMGYSKSTIYRWHKNPCRYGIEGKLNFFLEQDNKLLVSKSIFCKWIISRINW